MASEQQPHPDEGSRDDSASEAGFLRQYRLLIIVIGLGLLCTSGGLTALWFVWNASASRHSADLNEALAALDAGDDQKAARLASQYKSLSDWAPSDLAKIAYILGVTTYHRAERIGGAGAADRYLAAARLLEEAAEYGWPEGRGPEGWYLLGKSLYESGRYPAARLNLAKAAKLKQPRNRAESIRLLLAAAYLEDDPPQLDAALKQNDQYMKSPSLSQAATTSGLLQRGEILLEMGRIEEASAALAKLDAGAPMKAQTRILEGRLLEAEGTRKQKEDPQAAKALFEKAIERFRDAQAFDAEGAVAGEASYRIGVCLEAMGDYAAALEQFERTEETFAKSVEALPSALRRANLACRLGKTKLVLPACKKVVASYEKARFSSAHGVTRNQIVASAGELIQYYMDSEEYPMAERLARLFLPLLGEKESLKLRIDCVTRQGEAFFKQADRDPTKASRDLRRKGRTCMRTAGVLLGRLARLQFETREYPDLIWQAAERFFQGQDYEAAITMTDEFLKQKTKTGRPEALVLAAKSELALGKPDEAIRLIEECLTFDGKTAVAYRARLVGSECYVEKGDYVKAEKMLLENLDGELLSPESGEWRRSLFQLGELLLLGDKIDDAIVRLNEAVTRYPDSPETTAGYYALARAYHRRALDRIDALRRDWGDAIDVTKTPQVRKPLTGALRAFENVRNRLTAVQERSLLNETQRNLLANTLFSIADVQFDLGDYPEAARSYALVTSRYQNRPEVLEAYVQLSRAYRGMDKPRSAVAVLEQAKIVLARINPKLDLKATTLYNREEWEKRLEAEINQPPYLATVP